ncbi:MAG TPA: thiol protease, partial [Candidatus Odoribacter faecigallinarum]|nr:thiol protease [Candidatus Odoribacter faecigallinarum]
PYYFFENRGEEITEIQLSSTMTGISVRQHEPQLVFKVRLDYSSRDDISLVYGASEETDSNYPENRFTPVIFSNQGGDYAMQGAYSENGELEFALDYTEHLPQPDTRYGKYFLNIICSQRGQKSGSGTIEYFSVMDYRAEDGPREYVCKEAGSVPLAWGSNLFAVTTQPVLVVSASPCRWKEGDVPSSKTFIVRTAAGKYAKLKFIGYDRQTGKVTLQSLYQGDGSRNLTETGNE